MSEEMVSIDEILATEIEGTVTDADRLLVTRLRAALRIVWRNYLEQRSELAGAQGENMGLRVTAGFYENRCEVLEAAIAARRLTKRQQDSLAGCCPFCGVTVGEYVAEATKRLESELTAIRAACCGCSCGRCGHHGGDNHHTERCTEDFLAGVDL
jgi:hypothetical protein